MRETWRRFSPAVAQTAKVRLALADGTELTDLDASDIVNVEQLRSRAWSHLLRKCSCHHLDVTLTETATGRLLMDDSDLSPSVSGHAALKVSTHVEDLVSSKRLDIALPDGACVDADLSAAFSLRSLFTILARHTSRSEQFVSLYEVHEGERKQLLPHGRISAARSHVKIEAHLAKTVADFWSSQRLALLTADGKPLHMDLSEAYTLNDVRTVVGRTTPRPPRFVRFFISLHGARQEFKEWNAERFSDTDKVDIEVQLAPTVAELFSHHQVQLVNSLSGSPVQLDSSSLASLVSIQDLREAVASLRGVRATCVNLLAPSGKQLWDSEPFDLSGLCHGDAISICIRNPALCEEGQHEKMTFGNNGYNDHLCIHCGQECFMEGRLREPMRTGGIW